MRIVVDRGWSVRGAVVHHETSSNDAIHGPCITGQIPRHVCLDATIICFPIGLSGNGCEYGGHLALKDSRVEE